MAGLGSLSGAHPQTHAQAHTHFERLAKDPCNKIHRLENVPNLVVVPVQGLRSKVFRGSYNMLNFILKNFILLLKKKSGAKSSNLR